MMREQPVDTTHGPVVIRTRRGRITVGPHGQIDGLWRICQRELRTGEQVRKMAGGVTRHTLIAWRTRTESPFPAPVVALPAGRTRVELWSRTEVETWLSRRASSASSPDAQAV